MSFLMLKKDKQKDRSRVSEKAFPRDWIIVQELICRDGFEVQMEKGKLTVVCSCSPQNL